MNVGRKPRLTPEIQEFISRKETLQEWVNLGLEERTVKIQERFGIKVCDKSLHAMYKKLNIRYLRPQYRFYRATTQQEQL